MDNDGTTFLMNAATRSATAVKFLLKRGANIRGRNRRGEGAIHTATCAGNVEALATLLSADQADVDGPDLCGVTPLMRAAESGLPELVSLLLEYGADVDAATSLGKTALHFAMLTAQRGGQVEVIRALLDAGAAVDEETNDGVTPLLHIVKQYVTNFKDPDCETLVELLLQGGADPTHKDLEGRSPLSVVLKLKKKDRIRRLIERAVGK